MAGESDAGKGDDRRPRQISRDEWDRRYDLIDWGDDNRAGLEVHKDFEEEGRE